MLPSDYTVAPRPESTQPRRIIEGYVQTAWRNPSQCLQRRPLTWSELTGPRRHDARLSQLGADVAGHAATQAIGQLILVRLAIVDEDGAPVPGTMVEMWQANSAGRYVHPNDSDHAPIDPHFYGAARVLADDDGCIELRTVKPGAYPVPDTGKWWRPPHIHFSVWGRIWLSRLVTQMYFPGEPLNVQDRILNSVPDHDARERLIARALAPAEGPDDALVFEHRIVVRGRRATPAQT